MADPDRKFPLAPLPPHSEEKLSKKTKPTLLLPKGSLRAAAKASSATAKSVAAGPGRILDRINKELYKRNAELAARNKTLGLLRTLDEISLANSNIEDIAQKITQAIATTLGYDLVSVAIVDTEKNALQWLGLASPVKWVQAALTQVPLDRISLPLNEHLDSLTVVREQKDIFADDLHKLFPPILVSALEKSMGENTEPVQYSMIYPLRYSEQTLGLLALSSRRSLEDLSQYERQVVSGVVGLIALALYKAKIYDDLQRTSKALTSANEQLKNLDKAKSEFLSIASHQLYTPLTALRGYISMLQEGDFGQVAKEQEPVLKILDTSASRLIELIKNLLDISRIESGRLELNLVSIDLAQMAKSLVQDLLPNAITKGLKLVYEEPKTPLAHVVADEQRIRQVMLNFTDNAIKYTPQGNITVSVHQEGQEIVFAVTDTGKGITLEEIDRLFNKFSRVGGAARFHTEGTGLGLYVARQIVREHRGDVLAESPGEGKGSTFSMRLPIEGSKKSLKLGDKATVVIKAADANGQVEVPSTPPPKAG